MADINLMAQTIIDKRKPSNSLIPTNQTAQSLADLIPDRPEYTPYTRQEFDNSPRSGPGSQYGWTWTPGIKTRQVWDQEQDAKANDALNTYNSQLQAWKDMAEIIKLDWQNKQEQADKQLVLQNQQLAAQNLVPTTSLNDISAQLRQNGAMWKAAYDAGNYELAEKYHQANEALRQAAGWGSGGADGSLTAGYMSAAGSPNANALAVQQETLVSQAKLRMSIPGYEATAEDAAILGIPEGTVLTPIKTSGGGGGYSSGGNSGGGSQDTYGNYSYYTGVITDWLVRGESLNDVLNSIDSLTPKNTGLTQTQINNLKDFAENRNLPGYNQALKYFGLA